MDAKIYIGIPDDARRIRQQVFIEEQGFEHEYDETDETAAHIVMYDGETAVATCRIFIDAAMGAYVLGRLAVLKPYRGRHLGALTLGEAEKYVREQGGKSLSLHAQCRATDFYKKCGFESYGNVEYDEGCPHIWMKKIFD